MTIDRLTTLSLTIGAIGLGACSPSTTAETSEAGPVIELADFEPAVGEDWTGSLTYLNYGEPKKDFTIPAEASVSIGNRGVTIAYRYPEEPEQNGKSTISIKDNGRRFGDQTVVSRTMQDTALEIMTTSDCNDMGQSATCTYTYMVGAQSLSVKKMVALDDGTPAFRRSVYQFTR